MKICMIGTGYVGLVSGACFADLGNSVWCVDTNVNKINMLNNNEIPIYEPGLEEIINVNFKAGRLKFTNNIGMAIKDSDIIFICVGTPLSKSKKSADLKYVKYCSVTNSKEISVISNSLCSINCKSKSRGPLKLPPAVERTS